MWLLWCCMALRGGFCGAVLGDQCVLFDGICNSLVNNGGGF